jgi:hypothetical protein
MKWYSPTPLLEINTAKKRQSFYGFVDLKTGQQHTFTTDKQNMLVTAEILTKVRALCPTTVTPKRSAFHPTRQTLTPRNTSGSHVTHNRHSTKLREVAEEFRQYLESRTSAYELLGFRAGAVAS